jgi:seryl-tRNA synthetase
MSSDNTAKEFYDELVKHELIIPVGVQGVFGRSAEFEDVVLRFNDLVSRTAKEDKADLVQFPPVLSRKVFEKSGYLDSFPQLAGSVFSFFGKESEHQELMARVHAGKPWADLQGMTDVVLTPAGCYPVYPTLAGKPLPESGRLIDLQSWVFRHEPSPEPTRMQSFRMREFVRAGTPEMVVRWRDMWLERGLTLLRGLGLAANPDTAADPFFGRGGRMLKANQKEQRLKFEVLVPVISETDPTAICSFNYHQDHFGKDFGIQTSAGEVAHTACLGFGLERVAMSLFKTHGFKTQNWPEAVRKQLWP